MPRMRRTAVTTAAGSRRVLFPSIGTGAYRYPVNQAARAAVRAIRDFLANDWTLEMVVLVAFDALTRRAYEAAAAAE
jgi:O-acetyl-ADP-ribose deacetylase (regulator of RNase III)